MVPIDKPNITQRLGASLHLADIVRYRHTRVTAVEGNAARVFGINKLSRRVRIRQAERVERLQLRLKALEPDLPMLDAPVNLCYKIILAWWHGIQQRASQGECMHAYDRRMPSIETNFAYHTWTPFAPSAELASRRIAQHGYFLWHLRGVAIAAEEARRRKLQ